MPTILAMFPGQGSQQVAMGRSLCEAFPEARLTFQEASEAVGFDVLQLCSDGTEEELKLTANTQPAILTMSTAMWRILTERVPVSPRAFAGHSLGEYSALVAAGKLGFSQAVGLVRRRGEAMQDAVPAGAGAMSAVMNMDAEDLVALCAKFSNDEGSVEVVNFNSAQQLVIAGHHAYVMAVNEKLEADGVRVVPLPVSAPFHSKLMAPAREVMTPLLEEAEFIKNEQRVIANLTGKTVAAEYGPRYLIEQIDSAVLWMQSLKTAVEDEGCDTFVEIGPGRVLFGLAKRSVPRGSNLLTSVDLAKLIDEISGLT